MLTSPPPARTRQNHLVFYSTAPDPGAVVVRPEAQAPGRVHTVDSGASEPDQQPPLARDRTEPSARGVIGSGGCTDEHHPQTSGASGLMGCSRVSGSCPSRSPPHQPVLSPCRSACVGGSPPCWCAKFASVPTVVKGEQGTLWWGGHGVSSGSPAFDDLRRALSADAQLRTELEQALRANVYRVNPTDRANRFGSGGAVEWILASAAFAAGVLSVPGGHNTNGFDLRAVREDARGLWSVKNQTSPKAMAYRITNGLGGSGEGFTEPTVFLSPNLPGIVFTDPDVHTDLAAQTYDSGDATMLGFAAVRAHAIEHPECVAACEMPANPGTGEEDPWLAFVESLLNPQQYPTLARMFVASKPTQGTVASELQALVALRDAGSLTREQFDAAVRQVVQG